MADISDYLPASLQVASTILSAGAALSKGEAYAGIGARTRAADEFQAKQLEGTAATSQSVAMNNAANEALNLQVVNSLALARAAASGAGAGGAGASGDRTVVNLLAQNAGESAYRQSVAMYEGESQARLDLMRAAAVRYSGAVAESDANAAKDMSVGNAASTILSGGAKVMSMYERYWAGPKKDDDLSIPSG